MTLVQHEEENGANSTCYSIRLAFAHQAVVKELIGFIIKYPKNKRYGSQDESKAGGDFRKDIRREGKNDGWDMGIHNVIKFTNVDIITPLN